jgi:hypothetical protein
MTILRKNKRYWEYDTNVIAVSKEKVEEKERSNTQNSKGKLPELKISWF